MLSKQNFFGKRDEALASRETRPTVPPVPTVAGNPAPPKPATQASPASSAPAVIASVAKKTEFPKSEPPSGSRLIVGSNVKLKGAEILDCDMLVVEGRVEATMDSRVIHIMEQGSFHGKVCIDVAEIHGVFEGELTARSQLLIHATGRVSGKIRYGKILIDEGGELSGEIKALTDSESAPGKPRNEALPTLTTVAG